MTCLTENDRYGMKKSTDASSRVGRTCADLSASPYGTWFAWGLCLYVTLYVKRMPAGRARIFREP